MVGGDVLAEDAERRVAVALGQIAEHLVVGAVLLDDIDDVLEDARLADALGHGPGRLVRARGQFGFLQQTVAEVVQRRLGQARQFPLVRHRHQRQGAEILMRVVFDGLAGLEVFGGADAFDVGDAERLAAGS